MPGCGCRKLSSSTWSVTSASAAGRAAFRARTSSTRRSSWAARAGGQAMLSRRPPRRGQVRWMHRRTRTRSDQCGLQVSFEWGRPHVTRGRRRRTCAGRAERRPSRPRANGPPKRGFEERRPVAAFRRGRVASRVRQGPSRVHRSRPDQGVPLRRGGHARLLDQTSPGQAQAWPGTALRPAPWRRRPRFRCYVVSSCVAAGAGASTRSIQVSIAAATSSQPSAAISKCGRSNSM